tara:strand:- start:326 stop:514 length:189 start_codon:yes stop_codon:yes gene_type:complete
MSKKLYRLSILFDEDEEACESLCETVDIVNDDNDDMEMLTINDYADSSVREALIKAQIMGDA